MPVTANPKYFVVHYRTGGWMNAKWHATVPATKEKAREMMLDTRKMGYKAFLVTLDEHRNIGLPVGFCRHANPLTGKMTEKACSCN